MESRDDSAEVAEAKAFMDAFRKRATETSELHASDPGAGAGKSRLLIEISSSRPDDMVGTETPRAALTSLSFILRNLGVFQAVLIGRGKFSEVYSGRDAEGRANGHAIKVAKDAASLVSIKEGQAGTEAYALHLGAMYSKSGGSSPFLSSSILMAVPAAGGQYVAVLLMDEAKGTATEVVKMLAEGIKSDGSFSQPGLEMARDFVRAVLERLFPLHFLLIAHRDLKPANLLMKGVNVFLADPAFAMFPTSRHIARGVTPNTEKDTPARIRKSAKHFTWSYSRYRRAALPPSESSPKGDCSHQCIRVGDDFFQAVSSSRQCRHARLHWTGVSL